MNRDEIITNLNTIKNLVDFGLSIAQNGRRDQQDIEEFIERVQPFTGLTIWIYDSEDHDRYPMKIEDLINMGNKSARLASLDGIGSTNENNNVSI